MGHVLVELVLVRFVPPGSVRHRRGHDFFLVVTELQTSWFLVIVLVGAIEGCFHVFFNDSVVPRTICALGVESVNFLTGAALLTLRIFSLRLVTAASSTGRCWALLTLTNEEVEVAG